MKILKAYIIVQINLLVGSKLYAAPMDLPGPGASPIPFVGVLGFIALGYGIFKLKGKE